MKKDNEKDLKEIVSRRSARSQGLFMLDDVPAGFKDVKYTVTIETSDNKEEVRLLAEKVIAHCPVVDSLVRPTNISGKINIIKGEQ